MGDEFYSIIKLVSGEEIFSLISVDENDGDPIIILQSPVVMKIMQNSNGMFIKVKPWLELSNDDILILKQDKIITMTESTDEKLIGLYNHYLSNDDDNSFNYFDESSGKVKVSTQMGYISTVEEARKRLEKIFKDIKES